MNLEQGEHVLEHLVYEVSQGTLSATGPQFFQSLVGRLARVLPADLVFAGAVKPGTDRNGSARIVALASAGNLAEAPPSEFDIAETPFANLTFSGAVPPAAFSYAEGAAELFPNDPILRRVPAQTYIGAPLAGSEGQFRGILLAIARRVPTDVDLIENVIRMFSLRAAAELERIAQLDVLERRNTNLRRMLEETSGLKRPFNLEEMVGNSPEFRAMMGRIQQLAGSAAAVLITGETGSGKQLAAKALHHLSPRAGQPMLAIDTLTIPPAVIDAGLLDGFKHASGGALLIDEVTALSPDTQAKLLRMILRQEANAPETNVDVRLILTTNRPLDQAVHQGLLRADLYHRLLPDRLAVPPLRDRREDIALLTAHFLRLHARQLGRPQVPVSEGMIQPMLTYDWPGNIRELENYLFRYAVSPETAPMLPGSSAGLSAEPAAFTPMSLEEAERRHVQQTLATSRGVIEGARGAAAALQIPPSTLRSLMKRLGVQRAPKMPLH